MASRESSLLFSLERGLSIALQARQEKKALSSRGRGRLRGFLELRRPWGFSPEARRGSQGSSRVVPGKSGLHARGEGVDSLCILMFVKSVYEKNFFHASGVIISTVGGKFL